MMENLLILTLLAGIIGGIVCYLYREKKRGATCIGCPYAKQCGAKGRCSGSADASKQEET